MSESEPQTSFDVLMMQAQQAHKRRQWATLDTLLRQARWAPDAPPWEEERFAVEAWEELAAALATHQSQAHALIHAVVQILIRRVRERYGAVGAPHPTFHALCDWLQTEVETLDMELVEEAVEERWRGADISRQFLRTNAQRDNSWHWKRMGEDLSA